MDRDQLLQLCATSGTNAYTFTNATLKELMVIVDGEEVLVPVPHAGGYILICLAPNIHLIPDLVQVPLATSGTTRSKA